MPAKHLKKFPKPLLDDLVAGRWLPVIGAGFSRNAVLPHGKTMPLWNDLGVLLGQDLGEYDASTPLDAISAYEHEFKRSKLIERLSELLLIDDARPGSAHEAFCSIPFDIVCTTNFDFLLERQYELNPRHCTPLIDEDQLSINLKDTGIGLLKLHGDVNHPNRMIATETDYDTFLDKYPLLATFLANLLITRTAVLVGYSLDDPDFRQVWQILGERLGRHRRTAYTLGVGIKRSDIARFERRGVHVIDLGGSKTRYKEVLSEVFAELADFWRDKVIPASQVKEEQPLRELSLPNEALTRLCFFAVPLRLLSFYRERVFPIASKHGFVPISADDVVSPGDTITAKIQALIQRTLLIVADASSQNTLLELGAALQANRDGARILVIAEPTASIPIDIRELRVIFRPDVSTADPDEFLVQLDHWFSGAAERLKPLLLAEPARLLAGREYRAAIIAAISLLEATLRQRLELPRTASGRRVTLTELLEEAKTQGLLGDIPVRTVLDWLRTRNQIVHGELVVAKSTAELIVYGVLGIVHAAG
jgi:hypothetical protein